MAVFLLIGKTSALTMNIAGVVKDWVSMAVGGSVRLGAGAGVGTPGVYCRQVVGQGSTLAPAGGTLLISSLLPPALLPTPPRPPQLLIYLSWLMYK